MSTDYRRKPASCSPTWRERLTLDRFCTLAIIIAGLAGVPAFAADHSIVSNGDFAKWEGDLPDGWTVEVGATNGADSPESEVRQIAGPALMLRGDSTTMAWRTVTQTLNVEPGRDYRLEFDARSKDVRREGRQFDNCHVALMSTDAGGKIVGRAVQDVSQGTEDWKHFVVDYTVPGEAAKTVVYAFLSKSGLIGIKQITVTPRHQANSGEQQESTNLIRNGRFDDWNRGVPASWTVEIGAKNGSEVPLSQIEPLAEAGVGLSGNARTMAWRSLSQDVKLTPGKSYTLSFEASAERVQRQGRQFDNCYVGLMHFDDGGNRLDMDIQDLSRIKQWKPQTIRFDVPAGTAKSTILIFLSKSGTLKIKDVSLVEATREKPFH